MRAASADRARRTQYPLYTELVSDIGHSHSFTERHGSGSPKSEQGANSEMLDIKVNRKKAESELQQMANRVALLKIEEQKAFEKVGETRSRVAEIIS